MSVPTSINIALCLPVSDVAALSNGQMITALSKTFVNSVHQFVLCPVQQQGINTTISVDLWAKLEYCQIYSDPKDLKKLSQLTIWSAEELQNILEERHKLFLLCLRVFRLNQPVNIPSRGISTSKVGGFVKLSSCLSVSSEAPVLDEALFNQRKQRLIDLEAPPHPELDELLQHIASLAIDNVKAKSLSSFIQFFLGWSKNSIDLSHRENIEWIYDINALGNRSKDLDEGKSNYQAGTDFENVVRDALSLLGFSIEEAYKGGAGGLDLFCSKPYPLVGECKAGKKIPSGTTQELIKLGGMHLGRDQFLESKKLIIGPGKPTQDVLTAAAEWKVSIINPMSLQKLAELHVQYPGSIDLIELKDYLEPGQIDYKIDEYIKKVLEKIEIRIHIVQIIHNYLSQVRVEDASVDTCFGIYCVSHPPKSLNQKEFREILIELSSPLTGYLGRRKSADGSDRFYFLRDMPQIS